MKTKNKQSSPIDTTEDEDQVDSPSPACYTERPKHACIMSGVRTLPFPERANMELPAYILCRSHVGESILHGLGMTPEGLSFVLLPEEHDDEMLLSLIRAIKRADCEHMAYDWNQRHEVNTFMSTIAQFHRDEEETLDRLCDLSSRLGLPHFAERIPQERLVDVAHLSPKSPCIALSALEKLIDEQWLKHEPLGCMRFGSYEIIVNHTPDSYTIGRTNSIPLRVAGQTYTILRDSVVVGVTSTEQVMPIR